MSNALRIGIAGLGTVGCGVLTMLQDPGERRLPGRIEIAGVCARARQRSRRVEIAAYRWFDDATELARHSDVDVLVELIGGEDGPALDAVQTALSAGKSVVTANKALIAHHGLALARLAERSGAALLFEAAVAGSVPIVRAVRESLAGTRLSRISGILNGTCNYIMSRMRRTGEAYDACLAEAKALGYAEADPHLDVSGTDSAHKIAILASIGFGIRPAFARVGIDGIEAISPSDIALAGKMGFRIRLVAQARRTERGVKCRVEPVLVGRSHPLHEVEDALNAVVIESEEAGTLCFTGAGAGAMPTASAVLGDLAALFHNPRVPPCGLPGDELAEKLLPPGDDLQRSAWFLRLHLADESGSLAALSNAVADAGMSIDALHQDFAGESGAAPVAVVAHACPRPAAETVLARVAGLPACVGSPRLFRLDN